MESVLWHAYDVIDLAFNSYAGLDGSQIAVCMHAYVSRYARMCAYAYFNSMLRRSLDGSQHVIAACMHACMYPDGGRST